MTSETIEVPEDLLQEMVRIGAAQLMEDGVYEMSPEFNAWFNAWLRHKLDAIENMHTHFALLGTDSDL